VTARACVFAAVLAGCGSVSVAGADAAPDVQRDSMGSEREGAAGADAGGADVSAAGGAAGSDAGALEAAPEVPPLGNCYEVHCGDTTTRAAAGASCNISGAANTCTICADQAHGAVDPPCASSLTGRRPRDYYVHDCTDPLCQ
jgi:hypothetical protein